MDTETDLLIQETIRESFADCTMLTIAHRLHTVLGSDRIMVLTQGQVSRRTLVAVVPLAAQRCRVCRLSRRTGSLQGGKSSVFIHVPGSKDSKGVSYCLTVTRSEGKADFTLQERAIE